MNFSVVVLFLRVDEPRISLPETFGACLGTPAKVSVTLLDNNNEKPHFWVVHWFLIRYVGNKRIRTFTGKRSVTLTIDNPELIDTGKIYEVEVSNRYGRARGETRIIVTKGKLFQILDEFSVVIPLESS